MRLQPIILTIVWMLSIEHAHGQPVVSQPNQSMARIKVSDSGKKFVQSGSNKEFVIWGVNYDHDGSGRLLDEYWIDDWKSVVSDFREIKELGANCVRVHLQVGKFLSAPDKPNQQAIDQLKLLLQLAEKNQLYLDITGLACYHKSNIPKWFDQLCEKDRWSAQAMFWESIAHTCKGHDCVLCYDLMNEPILPGKKPASEWLGGELSGKFFVQRISLDLKGRSRLEVAEAWVAKMVSAIRKHDKKAMITVGVIPWVLTWPNSKPIFYSPQVAKHLDFVAVHFYPRKNEVDKALKALKAYEMGKPLVIEEMFPLKCSQKELVEFINKSSDHVDGWISFYWGQSAKELLADKDPSIGKAITAAWLQEFQRLSSKISK